MPISPNILVVGGDTDWQQILCDLLREEGHKPYPAVTLAEVEQILQMQSFEVAVIDPLADPAAGFSPCDLLILQTVQHHNPEVQVVLVSAALPAETRDDIRRLFPIAPILDKNAWDQNYFISLVKAFVGEGPNTDDARLWVGPRPSRFGTRPLDPLVADSGAGRPRILFLDTRSGGQPQIIELFVRQNYFWRMADTVEQALRILENENFHLVLIDLEQISQPEQVRTTPLLRELLGYLVTFRPKTRALLRVGPALDLAIRPAFAAYPMVTFITPAEFEPTTIERALDQATRSPRLKIETLGPFRIWRSSYLVGHWNDPLAETLVKILLTRQAGGIQAASANELLAFLWPDPVTRQYTNLLPVVNAARMALEPAINPMESSFILRTANGYYFDVGANVDWDLLKFRAIARKGKYFIDTHQWDEALTQLELAYVLYEEDYLAEEERAPWLLDLRRQVRKEYNTVLTDLADVYAAQGRYQDGVKICSEALVIDPLVESVYRRLMRFHYWLGQKEEALKVYRMCVKLFEELFGESPKPITRRLQEMILNDEEIVNTLQMESISETY